MKRDLFTLAGKCVIVTGASQGIGLAVSELVLELGGNVVAVSRDAEHLEGLAAKAPAGRVLCVPGNVEDPTTATRVVASSIERFGAVDGLVNNAGIVRPALIDKMTHGEWQEVLDVHLSGSFYFLQAVGQHMVGRAKTMGPVAGAIINVSSDAGRRGTIGQINYGAAKSGVLGLTMCAAREWGRYGVRVNSVCFGVVETQMTEVVRSEKFRERYRSQIPMARFSTPEEVAPTVCFLLSDASSYTTGQHLSINGGLHIGF
ncbi:SDR family NAD(P)-dependent oxidoreductase [Paraburkholderia caribensis]|uniref:SDR family NAD(P)-dependent oxidoreductase n=1 Tax=Paraburkholderia caribensis TaxID=75105 RepID=UPI001CC611AC|nr:SDR family NAD(P)-dependent oxidoreductase [Paraburkholderia caribensis]